jgi:uncharacterized protein (DUF1800 family)
MVAVATRASGKKPKKPKRSKKVRKPPKKKAPKKAPATVTSYAPASYWRTAMPSAYELHVIKRLGTGYSTATLAAVRRAGGIDRWFAQQLEPATVPEASIVAAVDAWYAHLRRAPAQKVATNDDGTKMAWQYGLDLANWTVLRRIHSTRAVQETMVDFWTNHLHISTGEDRVYTHQFAYDATIRTHALGRFEDLLVATATHPAMSLYLDNWRSRKNAPNENQGRELLELHTVGTGSGYTEDMVKDSAKILSGYSVRWGDDYEGFYDAANHTTGRVSVLGFTHDNTAADGREVAEAYLRHLANHPATARTVATRLALRFVSDTPSEALVSHLAGVFQDSGTDIKATLRALVAHPEFRGHAGAKVSTPVDDLVATVKALGVTARRPTGDGSFANHLNYAHGGLRLYSWPRPDGAPETNPEWTSAVRMLRSFRMHWNLAGGYYPKTDATFVPARSRVPLASLRFDYYFDHLSRSLLGRRSTARSLQAACLATGLTSSSVITPAHAVGTWMFPHLAAVLLDSPEHVTR